MSFDNIEQFNDNPLGYATAAQPLQKHGFVRQPNIGMDGNNNTRFNPITIVVDTGTVDAVLNDNRWRNYLMIQNQSANDIRVGFGVTPTSLSSGFRISGGGFFELNFVVPFNSVFVVGTATGQVVNVIEGKIDLDVNQR